MNASDKLSGEDYNEEEDEQELEEILDWTFNKLLKNYNTKEEIICNIEKQENRLYKELKHSIDEKFLKTHFLGFSYLVPEGVDLKTQQKYFSSVFRNINVQGEALLPLESRKALYYLDGTLAEYFDPEFHKKMTINSYKLDFVRYLSLLAQYNYKKDFDNIARVFYRKMEKYYEDYIYFTVNDIKSDKFIEFTRIFPNGIYNDRIEELKDILIELEFPQKYESIIDADVYLFGLINLIIFENGSIDYEKKDILKEKIIKKVNDFKDTRRGDLHYKNPAAFKYLRERIKESINIYKEFSNVST